MLNIVHAGNKNIDVYSTVSWLRDGEGESNNNNSCNNNNSELFSDVNRLDEHFALEQK